MTYQRHGAFMLRRDYFAFFFFLTSRAWQFGYDLVYRGTEQFIDRLLSTFILRPARSNYTVCYGRHLLTIKNVK